MDDFFDYITKDLYDDAYSIISRIFPKKLILNKTASRIADRFLRTENRPLSEPLVCKF